MRVPSAHLSKPPHSMAPKAKRKKKNQGRKREVYWTNAIARMRAQAAEQGQEANSPDSDYLDDETSIRLLWEVAQQEAHDELALPIDCASCEDWHKDGKQALKDEMGDECEAEVKGEADPWGEYTARTVILKKNVVQLNTVTTELAALTSKLMVLSKTNPQAMDKLAPVAHAGGLVTGFIT